MAKRLISVLEFYNIEKKQRSTLEEFDYHIEAPNWSGDGKYLVYNSGGKIYRFDLETKKSELIFTGKCTGCNNDHILSSDGKFIAISAGTDEDGWSRIWKVSIGGGEPELITQQKPSYLHGLSPDGKTFAYCADRNGDYDVYTINYGSSEEIRLTDTVGLDDGPEYSSDGKTIWFCSVRSGLMQAWKMDADGAVQTQMTFCEEFNSWFPHISPDNSKVVMVSYYKDDVKPNDHPANKNIEIRLMNSDGSGLVSLFKTFGGQGTMNVNSWSPDSDSFAYVTYKFV